MDTMTISTLAAAGGVGVETVRFYQRRGLLDTPARTGSIRRYGPSDLRRLHFIRSAQAAGFTLEGIAELLGLDATHDRARVHALAIHRIAALDARIGELQEARDALSGLAHRCGEGGTGPCPILDAFDTCSDDSGTSRSS